MGNHYQKTSPHVTRIIKRLFNESEIALLAHKQDLLNVSAFVRQISPQVNKLARRTVSLATISTILSRYLKELKSEWGLAAKRQLSLGGVELQELLEISRDKNLATLKIKFRSESKKNPYRFYVILARLAVFEVRVLKLFVDNGNLKLVVSSSQAGLANLALRGLIKKSQLII